MKLPYDGELFLEEDYDDREEMMEDFRSMIEDEFEISLNRDYTIPEYMAAISAEWASVGSTYRMAYHPEHPGLVVAETERWFADRGCYDF